MFRIKKNGQICTSFALKNVRIKRKIEFRCKKIETHLNSILIFTLHTINFCSTIFAFCSPFFFSRCDGFFFRSHFFFYLEYGSFFKHTFDTQETTIKLFFRVLRFFFSLPIHWLWLTVRVHCARICAMPLWNNQLIPMYGRPMMPYTHINIKRTHLQIDSIKEYRNGEQERERESVCV